MTPRRRDFCQSQRFHAIRQIVAESSRSGVAFSRRLASTITLVGLFAVVSFAGRCHAQEPQAVAKAEPIETLRFGRVDGRGPDWKTLGEADFVVVNGAADTWKFVDGEIHSTGKPVGVMRTKEKYTNFEYVVQWRHLEKGGNSGIFAWVSDEGLAGIQPGQLPKSGIEVQMLDHGYHEKYTRSSGKVGDWFTSNGDIFAVGRSKMKPFPQRVAELPKRKPQLGLARVEPLLCTRDQRRDPLVGQRDRGVGGLGLRSRDRLPLLRSGRFARRVSRIPDPRAPLIAQFGEDGLQLFCPLRLAGQLLAGGTPPDMLLAVTADP
jgi:hypothetical protein